MNTDDLVQQLAHELEPASPLRRPAARAGLWFAGAALYVAALAIGMGLANGSSAGTDTEFWVVQAMAIATSLLASGAAFASVVPGASKRSRGLAFSAAAVWLATLAVTSISDDWSAISGASHEWSCVGFIVVGGAPLLAAITWMLRRGAPLTPATTFAFAALSVAALANVGACVSLPHANDAITLAWHGGVIVAATACAAAGGRLMFSWRHRRLS
jgi:hypothetical protein